MRLSLTDIGIFVLTLQLYSSYACHLPEPSIINSENYLDTFLWNVSNCTLTSEDMANNTLEMITKTNRKYAGDLRKLSNIFPRLKLERWIETYHIFDGILSYYKDSIYEHFGVAEQGNILLAKQYLERYERLQETFEDHVFFNLVNSYDVCQMEKSQYQFFSDLFKIIQYTTAQIYATADIINLSENRNNTDAVQRFKSMVNHHYLSTVRQFKSYMKSSSRYFYVCNPKTNDSATHIELQAFQRYLFTTDQIAVNISNACPNDCRKINNVTANEKIVCNEKKDYIRRNPVSGIKNNNDEICFKTKKCKNLKCLTEGFLGSAEVCVNPRSEKRYQFYEIHPNKTNINERKQCTGGSKIMMYQKQARKSNHIIVNYAPTFKNCPICNCICADNDFYVSMGTTITDVNDHKVVVGAQFDLSGNTLYIDLIQGKLLPNGSIDAQTVSKKRANRNTSNRVKLSWDGVRSMALTKAIVPKGNVVVGLHFVKNGEHIVLGVDSMPYDFHKGNLKSQENVQQSNESADAATRKLRLAGNRKPTWSNEIEVLSKDENEFVTFTTSDSQSDGGQSTVPFIDAQKVIPPTLTPLVGAGLFYKSQKGFGGYIGMKLIEFDTTPYINA